MKPCWLGLGRLAANQHTWYARDPVSQQPQLKSSPDRMRRKEFGYPEDWLVERQRDVMGEDTTPYAARGIGATQVPAQ